MIKIEGNKVVVLVGAEPLNIGINVYESLQNVESLVIQESAVVQVPKEINITFSDPEAVQFFIDRLEKIKKDLTPDKPKKLGKKGRKAEKKQEDKQ